jgi:hypothetical protein
MRSTENITTKPSGGSRTRLRSLLALVIATLALTAGMTASPTAAQADACDGTNLRAVVTDAMGRPIPNPPGPGVPEVTMSLSGPYRYLAVSGVIRPNGFAVFSIYRDTPTGSTLLAQVGKTAEDNGVIRQEPASFDLGVFARPGDRLRVQGFWETNAFCTPSRTHDETLLFVNVVP